MIILFREYMNEIFLNIFILSQTVIVSFFSLVIADNHRDHQLINVRGKYTGKPIGMVDKQEWTPHGVKNEFRMHI